MKKIENIKEKRRVKKDEIKKLKKEQREKREKELKLKAENRKVSKKFINFSQLLDIDDFDNIVLKEGLLDIYKLRSFDISGMNEYESHGSILSFTSLLKTYHENLKIIAMNFPTNTSIQKEYIKRKIKETNDEIKIKYLQKSYKQLEDIERVRSDREYYVVIFADNIEELEDRQVDLLKAGRKMGIDRVDIDKKIKILYKLNNMNSKVN